MNICVIGLGSMGRRRIRLLQKIIPDVSIIGIDYDPNKVRNTVDAYGIKCFSSMNDINMDLDCAFVCTSPQFHAKIIQECLEKDMHVFSEINLIDDLYKENISIARKKNKVLFLSSTPLYKREIQIIDERVKKSKLGCVYQYHVGQYLPDWHPWDNLEDFFVSRKATNGCRELLAIELPWILNTFGKIRNINVIKKQCTNLKLEFPDTYLIQLEHETGNAGNLIVDVVSRQAARKLEVLNEELYIRWDGTPDSLYEKDILSGQLKQVKAGEYIHEKAYGEFINEYAYAEEMEEFFKVIDGKTAIYGFEKDIDTLEIIDRIEGEK